VQHERAIHTRKKPAQIGLVRSGRDARGCRRTGSAPRWGRSHRASYDGSAYDRQQGKVCRYAHPITVMNSGRVGSKRKPEDGKILHAVKGCSPHHSANSSLDYRVLSLRRLPFETCKPCLS
jgi:hypothetical protein